MLSWLAGHLQGTYTRRNALYFVLVLIRSSSILQPALSLKVSASLSRCMHCKSFGLLLVDLTVKTTHLCMLLEGTARIKSSDPDPLDSERFASAYTQLLPALSVSCLMPCCIVRHTLPALQCHPVCIQCCPGFYAYGIVTPYSPTYLSPQHVALYSYLHIQLFVGQY